MKASILAIVILTAACSEQRGIPGGSVVGATGADGAVGRDGAPGATGAPGRDGGGSVDGSRLAVKYWVGADGSRFLAAVEDTKYDAPCQPVTISGETRCAFTAFGGAQIYYANSGCSVPVLIGMADMPKNVTSQDRFFVRGAVVAPDVYLGSPGSCSGPSSIVGQSVFAATEVPFSDFVSLTKGVQ